MSIGFHLRKIRQQQGRTLADVAGRSGCSLSMLSKIETDAAMPSVAILQAIAAALGVEPASLLCGEERTAACYEPAGSGSPARSAKGHLLHALAAAKGGKRMQPYVFTARKGEVTEAPLRRDGEEFVYVLEGELRYRVGLVEYHLRPGDTLYFDAKHDHDFAPVSDTCRWLGVICDRSDAAGDQAAG